MKKLIIMMLRINYLLFLVFLIISCNDGNIYFRKDNQSFVTKGKNGIDWLEIVLDSGKIDDRKNSLVVLKWKDKLNSAPKIIFLDSVSRGYTNKDIILYKNCKYQIIFENGDDFFFTDKTKTMFYVWTDKNGKIYKTSIE